MPTQVSVQAILDMAIQLEERGREFYATASELVGHPGAKELLRELAEDEVAHADLFRRVQERGDYEALARGPVPEDLRLGDTLVETDLGPASTPQDILITAIRMEQAAIDLYSAWLALYRGTDVETVIEGLVNEERRHKARLEALYHDVFLEDW